MGEFLDKVWCAWMLKMKLYFDPQLMIYVVAGRKRNHCQSWQLIKDFRDTDTSVIDARNERLRRKR